MQNRQATLILYAVILALSISTVHYSAAASDKSPVELTNNFVTITDTLGSTILQTGLPVFVKDEFIDEHNRRYVITSVNESSATAQYVCEESFGLLLESIAVQAPALHANQLISVYHTHTDESYIPTDGKSTEKGDGSILLVGEVLSNRLLELGYQSNHDKTLHDPHDANAYHRSRRTVMKLLQKQPTALFDIHRDSAPAQIYNYQINGQEATKLLLVVGRQNQFKNTTLNFAKSIKAAADEKYKGFIRGIFIAKGGYNQDLNPRSILVEIGTQYNSRQAAERSAALFADLVPYFLIANSAAPADKTPAAPSPPLEAPLTENTDSGWQHDLLFITAAIIIGAVAFLLLSTGSLNEAKNKLYKFFKYEFADLFTRKKRK